MLSIGPKILTCEEFVGYEINTRCLRLATGARELMDHTSGGGMFSERALGHTR